MPFDRSIKLLDSISELSESLPFLFFSDLPPFSLAEASLSTDCLAEMLVEAASEVPFSIYCTLNSIAL